MNYMDKYNEWRNNPYFDKETKEELLNLEGNEKEIEDRFYSYLTGHMEKIKKKKDL